MRQEPNQDSLSEIVEHGVLGEGLGGSWAVLGRLMGVAWLHAKKEEIIKELPQAKNLKISLRNSSRVETLKRSSRNPSTLQN